MYGGTERVVSFLTEELVAQGQEVTLFASGDSQTSAKLVPASKTSLRLSKNSVDHLAHHIAMLDDVMRMAPEFDVIHSHMDYLGYPILRQTGIPFATTLHGRMHLPELRPVYETFDDVAVVSISDAQREPLPQANYVATIHHGIPERLLTPQPVKPSYLAFLGRIAPEKALDRAIRIATRCGLPLKIAAKIDPVDRDYFTDEIEPLLDQPGIEYIGEINDREKAAFLSGAIALLLRFPPAGPFDRQFFLHPLKCLLDILLLAV